MFARAQLTMKSAFFALALAALLPGLSSAQTAEREVDVELVLAVDVSRSMGAEEMEIQRRGYAAALTDPQVLDAIFSGLTGRVAITFMEWAGDGNQHVVVPWREIATPQDAQAFADLLLSGPSFNMRYTSISGAILTAVRLFDGNGFKGLKRVIDISGDGPNNQGVPVDEARDLAVANGIIINGLPLMTTTGTYGRYSIPDLDRYYIDCVIGGPASFSVPVTSWETFPEAVRRKLVLELAGGVPGANQLPVHRTAGEASTDCLIGERLLWQWDFNVR
ncbi:DUF1194 domain-containing protein [Salaquimonas pukyongi]|uniref:DUF1194 domain-containing protein n=1 Tax=Salaquimonas pukyongi TaxID=2712698 RepID=UPI00096BC377|nr:DUF1194 domain-containing protein [Salaquimonas pukyongi]